MKTNWILFAAALGGVLLEGCSRVGDQPPTPQTDAVSFTAGIAQTRTADGGDAWTKGDAVGIYMVASGGSITVAADLLAENVQYDITDETTGELSSASGTPIYYPLSGSVDFAAYYPYGPITAGAYNISAAEQSDPAAVDVLYAKTTGMSKNNPQVALAFAHVLAKVTLDVKAGTSITPDDISALDPSSVVFGGMPTAAALALQDGALTAGADLAQTFNPLKNPTVPTGSDASFTALLVPQAAGVYAGRTVTFTVGGQPYTWAIPDSEPFAAGNHYTYPVTVNKTGITVGDPVITDWTTRDNGTGMAKLGDVVPESNCYMVEPDGVPILIPVSRANKAADPNHNLGAATDGLGGVEAGNFTVELVWSDTPVGDGGVLKEMHPDDEYVFVRPGIAGNAVIAIRDKTDGTIKWSWHIWVTEPVGQAKDKYRRIWMDRNLGAKSNTPLVNGTFDQAQWTKTLGLYYQWGRKDAFPASDGTNNSQTYYTGGSTADIPEKLSTGSYTELPDMVQNPLNFATNYKTFNGSLNVNMSNSSWDYNSAKTLYDPCPPGWRVPRYGEIDKTGWSEETFGLSNVYYGGYFPFAGFRYLEWGGILEIKNQGNYWHANSFYNSSGGYFTELNNDNNKYGVINCIHGYTIRCRAE